MSNTTDLNYLDKKLKILVLGDSGVGKSSLIARYIQRDWQTQNLKVQKTLGIELEVTKFEIDRQELQVEFIELQGDIDQVKNYDIFMQLFYEENSHFQKHYAFHGIIYIYDCNNQNTLKSLKQWLKWYHQTQKKIIFGQNKEDENIKLNQTFDSSKSYTNLLNTPILFIGNQFDLFSLKNPCKIGELINSETFVVQQLMQKIKLYIQSCFSIKDLDKIILLCKDSKEQIIRIFEEFILITYQKSNSENIQNANSFSNLNYCTLNEFLYLKTFDFKRQKNFIQKFLQNFKNN